MAFIPQGLDTSSGQIGVDIDPTTGLPLAAVIEVLDVLPSLTDPANFNGRTIYLTSTACLNVFTNVGPSWLVLNGTGVIVGAVNGTPPASPSTRNGQLFFDTNTQTLFLWNGAVWLLIGGVKLGTSIKTQIYTSGGTIFPLGQTQTIGNDNVELFLDGVRQTPGMDYAVTGTTIVTTMPVNVGVTVLIRSTQTASGIQSAQVYTTDIVVHTPLTPNNNFLLGTVAIDPSSVLVFVNGNLKGMSTDYTINTQNTSITSITSIGASTAGTIFRATTVAQHGLYVGNNTMIMGGNLPFNNQVVPVTNVTSNTSFDFVLPTTLSHVTPTPLIYFYPPTQVDTIVFNNNLNLNDHLVIKYFKGVIPGVVDNSIILESTGSGISLAGGQTDNVLRVKSLVPGTNTTLVDNGTNVTINSINNNNSYTIRTGVGVSYAPTGDIEYIGVTNTTNQVIIDLSSVTKQQPGGLSKVLVIKDESGNAAINSIILNFGEGIKMDGVATYSINQNYGFVKIISDGTNWFKIGGSI